MGFAVARYCNIRNEIRSVPLFLIFGSVGFSLGCHLGSLCKVDSQRCICMGGHALQRKKGHGNPGAFFRPNTKRGSSVRQDDAGVYFHDDCVSEAIMAGDTDVVNKVAYLYALLHRHCHKKCK